MTLAEIIIVAGLTAALSTCVLAMILEPKRPRITSELDDMPVGAIVKDGILC